MQAVDRSSSNSEQTFYLGKFIKTHLWVITSDAFLHVRDLTLDLVDADDGVRAPLGETHLALGDREALQVRRVVTAEEAVSVSSRCSDREQHLVDAEVLAKRSVVLFCHNSSTC